MSACSRTSPFACSGSGAVLSTSGFQIAGVVVGWKIYADTGSALALGMIGLAQFLPMLLLTFVVGHVADRFDRRRIAMTCQSIECATLAVLALGIHFGFLAVEGIFAAVFVLGAARAFETPSMTSLAAPRGLDRGPAARHGGVVLGHADRGDRGASARRPALRLRARGVARGRHSLLRRRRHRDRIAEGRDRRHAAHAGDPALGLSGVSFIWQREIILGAVSLDMFAVLLGSVVSILPIFAQDILMVGPWGLGLLRSMPAIGAVSMSLVLARVDLQPGVGRKMFLAVMVFGLGTVVFSASTWLPLSCIALAVMGAADNISVVVRNSLVQIETPDEMRGRVNAVNALFIGTSNQLVVRGRHRGAFHWRGGTPASWAASAPSWSRCSGCACSRRSGTRSGSWNRGGYANGFRLKPALDLEAVLHVFGPQRVASSLQGRGDNHRVECRKAIASCSQSDLMGSRS